MLATNNARDTRQNCDREVQVLRYWRGMLPNFLSENSSPIDVKKPNDIRVLGLDLASGITALIGEDGDGGSFGKRTNNWVNEAQSLMEMVSKLNDRLAGSRVMFDQLVDRSRKFAPEGVGERERDSCIYAEGQFLKSQENILKLIAGCGEMYNALDTIISKGNAESSLVKTYGTALVSIEDPVFNLLYERLLTDYQEQNCSQIAQKVLFILEQVQNDGCSEIGDIINTVLTKVSSGIGSIARGSGLERQAFFFCRLENIEGGSDRLKGEIRSGSEQVSRLFLQEVLGVELDTNFLYAQDSSRQKSLEDVLMGLGRPHSSYTPALMKLKIAVTIQALQDSLRQLFPELSVLEGSPSLPRLRENES